MALPENKTRDTWKIKDIEYNKWYWTVPLALYTDGGKLYLDGNFSAVDYKSSPHLLRIRKFICGNGVFMIDSSYLNIEADIDSLS